jgi:GntR family transcriptional repressor for pyruvate dehydrogenase complex
MQPKVDDTKKAKRALTLAQDIVRDIEAGRMLRATGCRARTRCLRDTKSPERPCVKRSASLSFRVSSIFSSGVVAGRWSRARRLATSRSSLSLILQFMGADLRDLLELREAIAPDVAANAAQRATMGDLSALADCLKELERNEVGSQFEELNRRFHDLLGWASGNPLFGLLTSAMHLLTREFSHSLGYSAQERGVQLHFLRRVLEAVRTGDAEAARHAMARLVAGSASYLAERSPELVSQKVRWGQI